LAIVGITNSFNLIDGVNTLAGGLGILITSIFGWWFFTNGFPEYSLIAFSLTGALLGFLYYNKTPAKIFMGDTGSLLIGIVCSVLAIKFIEINRAKSIVTSAPVVAFGIMIVPLFDTLRVFVIRILNKKSPFSPDKNHLHHLLLRRGYSHHQVAIILISFNGLLAFFAFNSGIKKGEVLLGVLLLFVFLCSNFIASRKIKFRKNNEALAESPRSDYSRNFL
jgi:UDP-N-acetylmuramyl pentapeptide phosphotransferase/UDP-N-acetylglucosamine-1-phosphate transferase